MDHQRLTIVLAEDDDGHATLIRRNLKRSGLGANVVRVKDGASVLELMQRELAQDGQLGPKLLLLDIRMPGMDGIEVLKRMKSDPAMRPVPIYMLTTTDNPTEVNRCFELGCNAYLTKPVGYEAFVQAMERLCAFLEVSQVPLAPAGSSDAAT